jgi:hypothetical protein
MTPFLEMERVHVSKISFHVSSWTNLRKSPIVVDIEHIHARANEPLFFCEQTSKEQFQQIFQHELEEMIREGLFPKNTVDRGSYNIWDRIMDNLTVEIGSVTFEYQTWGKFKTRRVGRWTPPEIQVKLAGIRLMSVNEYGQEAAPDEVWSHNHHSHGSFMLYKKLEMEYQVLIQSNGEAIPLVTGRDNKIEVQVATQRNIRDGECLAVQIDVTIPHIEVDIPARVVPVLAKTVEALTSCLAKDRAFQDPLKPAKGDAKDNLEEEEEHEANLVTFAEESDDNTSDDGSVAPETFEFDSSSASESEEEKAPESVKEDTFDPMQETLSKPSVKVDHGRPLILLPNGLVIREKISLSVSIHRATIRGTYASNAGHVQVEAKGCVAELIWPKVNLEKGGYVQASVSYLSVNERHGDKIRPLVIGGVEYDNTGPLEQPGVPLSEVGRDTW